MVNIPIIAIVDTGIDYAVSYRKTIIDGRSLYIEDDTIYMSDEYVDENGHGTKVASVINRYCKGASLYIVKIYGAERKTSSVLLYHALEYLLTIDVDIINISLAIDSGRYTENIEYMIDKLQEQGKIVVSSVRNRLIQSFPANHPSCYGVYGVDDIAETEFYYNETDVIQIRANRLPEYVESLNGKYEWFGGNSKATACVSGLIATLLQKNYENGKKYFTKSFINNLLIESQNKGRTKSMDIIVRVIEVCRFYGEKENVVRALDNVNLEVKRGEFIAITGASGSGKSTILNVMGGLDNATSGTVMVEGKELSKMSDEQLTVFRRDRIGFVFQNFNLIQIMTVYENIVLPIHIGGKQEDKKFVNKIMHALGLDGLENRLPSQLSGGQQQRVAIARALATKPALILADEPTGNLDSASSDDVINCFKKAVEEFGQTVVMITHNDAIANECKRILTMKDGVLTEVSNLS